MMHFLSLKPAPGRRVRKPDGTPLAGIGETVEGDLYWLRRIADGDVIEIDLPATPASQPETEPRRPRGKPKQRQGDDA